MIRSEAASYSYHNGLVLQDISLTLAPGDLTAVIGPNGSGKTTLLRILSGALAPRSGRVLLDDRVLQRLNHRDLALQIAVVPQEIDLPFPFTVRELVELGRTPHRRRGWLSVFGARDADAVESAMRATGVHALSARAVNELSGGERQRAVIAMALAQEPRYLLLDEPTTHLDIQHQLEILELLARLNRERGLAVLATMHDLNLASLYFSRLVLLDGGRVVTSGPPSEVISESRLADVFHAGVRVTHHPVTGTPVVVVLPGGRGAAA